MKLEMMISQMTAGMVKTIGIFAWTLIFSLPFGLLIAFGRMSKNKILSTIVKVYISIMRGNTSYAAADGGILWSILFART